MFHSHIISIWIKFSHNFRFILQKEIAKIAVIEIAKLLKPNFWTHPNKNLVLNFLCDLHKGEKLSIIIFFAGRIWRSVQHHNL